MTVEFVHHHVHSEYSALDGMPSSRETAQYVKSIGQRGFSITDHGSMSGIPSMYREAKALDLEFSPGIEAYFAFDRNYKSTDSFDQKYYHLIFIANSFEGYQNISRMQRYAWEEGFYYKPRVDLELIEKFAGGFSVTTACLGSPVNQAFLRGDIQGAEKFTSDLVDIVGKENVYVEIQDHGIPEDKIVLPANVALAKKLDLKLLATNDSHYCSPNDAHDHEYLLCASTKTDINNPKRFKLETDQFYMKSGEEMLQLFPEADFPGAISNTVELSAKSDFTMPVGDNMKYLMPHFTVPEEYVDEDDMLRRKVYEGLRDPARYGDSEGNISDEVKERAEYELSVVAGMNFSGYFLIVARILDIMRENGIGTGAGRGSAPSSIIAYGLNITQLDPIKNNLLFWRFLNPDRISMPDIDIDIEKERRPQALKLLQEEFGHDNVAQLTTFTKMQTAAALERAAKACGFNPTMADLFKSKINGFMELSSASLSETWEASKDKNSSLGKIFDKEVMDDSFKSAFSRSETKATRACSVELILSIAARFEDKLMGYGVHACGLIITPGPVTDFFPVRSGKGLNVCQFDGGDAESMGAVKMDLLGIQSIDACQKTERNILEDLGKTVKTDFLTPDDPKVYETLSSGDGKGVFQMGCLAGDVKLDGVEIEKLYRAQENGMAPETLRSVCLNTGTVINNQLRKVVKSGVKNVKRILTSNGKSIEATDEHMFFTTAGWCKAGELEIGDHILYIADSNNSRRVGSAPRISTKSSIAKIYSKLSGEEWLPCSSSVLVDGQRYDLTIRRSDDSLAAIVYRDDVKSWSHLDNRFSNLIVIPEIDVFEAAAELEEGFKHLSIPDDASWQRIVLMDQVGPKMTYDVMMLSPANNAIANGFMVHNSGGMRRLMKKLKPTRFDDLSALLALYRPGPLGMGTPNEYADRKNNSNGDYDIIHPDAREILADSYGLCVVGRTLIWDASSGAPVRIDSIEDKVSAGFYTIGIDDYGRPEIVQVEKWFSLGNKSVYRLVVEGGVELVGTEDHPILTSHGWKKLSSVTSDDYIASPSGAGVGNTLGIDASVARKNGYEGEDYNGLIEPYDGITPQEAGRYENIEWVKASFCLPTGTIEEVFDISVSGNSHNFIANGLVVSNCIYQEHIMQIAQKFAGYTGGEADNLRKAMGKKIKAMMDKHEDGFTKAVNERYPDPVTYTDQYGKEKTASLGTAWWDIIEPFAEYAFNRSHSAAYAVLSYRTAYLKTYYPAQFGAASIDVDLNGSDKDKKGIDAHIEWMRSRDIKVYAPDINMSVNRGKTTENSVALPLNIVRGFGDKRVRFIIEEREKNGKFASIVDAVARVKLNKNEIVALAMAGAFESFESNRFAIVSKVDDILSEANRRKTELAFSDSMFDLGDSENDFEDNIDLLTVPSHIEFMGEDVYPESASLRDIEKKLLGLSVQPHPFSLYGDGLLEVASEFNDNAMAADELADAVELKDDTPVAIYGIAVNPEKKMSKKGNLYLRLTVETTEGGADVFVFPPKNEEFPEVEDGAPVVVVGSVKSGNREDDEKKMFGRKVITPDRNSIRLEDQTPYGIFEAKINRKVPSAVAVPNLSKTKGLQVYGEVSDVKNASTGCVFTLSSGGKEIRVKRIGGNIEYTEGDAIFALVFGDIEEVNGNKVINASKVVLKRG